MPLKRPFSIALNKSLELTGQPRLFWRWQLQAAERKAVVRRQRGGRLIVDGKELTGEVIGTLPTNELVSVALSYIGETPPMDLAAALEARLAGLERDPDVHEVPVVRRWLEGVQALLQAFAPSASELTDASAA